MSVIESLLCADTWAISQRFTLAGRPFHLLCVTDEELGPDGCCNTRKASGERVVEPGFESRSVFVSKT